ncbi:MAG: hypothetical protein IJC48_02075 [Clostridia bacterium]|nr:hypothetical protein [Clostridia bacterium]
MNKFQNSMYRFFIGRRGTDQLTFALLITAVILSLISSIFGLLIGSILSTAMWIYSLFRMLSKNIPAREKENQWFLSKYTPVSMYLKQAKVRFQNRKVYLYYHCPQCKAWLKLPRHIGEKTVTCGKCGATFKKKA